MRPHLTHGAAVPKPTTEDVETGFRLVFGFTGYFCPVRRHLQNHHISRTYSRAVGRKLEHEAPSWPGARKGSGGRTTAVDTQSFASSREQPAGRSVAEAQARVPDRPRQQRPPAGRQRRCRRYGHHLLPANRPSCRWEQVSSVRGLAREQRRQSARCGWQRSGGGICGAWQWTGGGER